MEKPVTGASRAPRHAPRVALTISPKVQSGSATARLLLQRGRDRVMIGKRDHGRADGLPGLVALAGDEQNIAALELGDGLGDCRARGRRSRWRRAPRPRSARRMAAAFSLRGLSSVTMARSALAAATRPHLGPLALVAVAAAAEHHDEPVVRRRAERVERLGERVGRVGVVDEDRRACRAQCRQDRAARARLAKLPASAARSRRRRRSPWPGPRRPARWTPGRRRPAASERDSACPHAR